MLRARTPNIAYVNSPSSLIAESPWTKQPYGSFRVDWSNPLTRNMVSCMELTSNRIQDLASPLVFTHPLPVNGTDRGRAIAFTGTGISTGVPSIGGQTLFMTPGNPLSMMMLCRRAAGATGNYFAKGSANSATRTFQIYDNNDGSNSPATNIRGVITSTNLGHSANTWRLYTVVYDGVSTTTATLYADGSTTASLSIGTAAEETTEPITIGSRTGTTGFPLTGNVAFVRIWSRALSQQEHQQLYQNPWQIFTAQTRTSYFLPSRVLPSIKQVRTRQPQQNVAIDWSNTLSRGLVSVIVPQTDRSLSTNTTPLVLTQSKVGTSQGISYNISSSGQYVQTSNIPGSVVGADNGLTVASLWIGKGTNTAAWRGIQAYGSTVNSYAVRYGIDNTGTTVVAMFNQGNVGLTTPIPNDTKVHFTAVSAKSTATSGTFFIDGTSETFNYSPSTISSDQPHLNGIYRTDATDQTWFANYVVSFVWKRSLTVSELRQVYLNPWQIFASQTQTLFYPEGIPQVTVTSDGSSSGSSTVSGTGLQSFVGAGSSSGSSTVSGQIERWGYLAGSATGSATGSAIIIADAAFAGNANGRAVATATSPYIIGKKKGTARNPGVMFTASGLTKSAPAAELVRTKNVVRKTIFGYASVEYIPGMPSWKYGSRPGGYHPEMYVFNDSNTLYYSVDGYNWSNASAFFNNYNNVNYMTYHRPIGKLICYGDAWGVKLVSFANGSISGVESYTMTRPAGGAWADYTYWVSNGRFFAKSTTSQSFWVSDNWGGTWSTTYTLPAGTNAGSNDNFFNGNYYFSTSSTTVQYTSDFVTWQQTTVPTLGGTASIVNTFDGMLVYHAAFFSSYHISTDGVRFTEFPNPEAGNVTYINRLKRFITVNSNGGSGQVLYLPQRVNVYRTMLSASYAGSESSNIGSWMYKDTGPIIWQYAGVPGYFNVLGEDGYSGLPTTTQETY